MKAKVLLGTVLAAAFAVLSGCKNSGSLLPSISGKAGEILVVMEKPDWEDSLGNDVRDLLAVDCPWLAQKEPLYSLVNVPPSAFGDLFQVHRNILLFAVHPQLDTTGIVYQHDVWAQPQCVIQISARSSAEASAILKEKGPMIVSSIEQAERDRVIRNTMRYEEKNLGAMVAEIFGGCLHFPTGYQFKKKTSDFIWIADEKQYTIQGVFVYRYPALGTDEDFSVANIIAHRNEVLRNNVPGMFDNTYMTTGSLPSPYVEYLKYQGRNFAQTRGYWEVANDYMGGPFVSHSFYSPDGIYVVVCDAFVYAPKYDKRQYLRQVESLLYSWEWKEEKAQN